jgi:ADP-heptose:LPS heptosyltransferase
MKLPSNPRLLISRMSAVGDTITTLPLLCALRDHFPTAQITWIVEQRASAVLKGHHDIDRLIVLDRLWLTSPSKLWKVRQQLRELRIDIAFDPQSRTKSAAACWLSGAPVRIGCGGKHGTEMSPYLNNRLVETEKPHVVDRTLALLEPLGIESPDVNFRVPIDSASRQAIRNFVENAHLTCGFAVINPGAGWDSRLWPTQRYASVARTLGRERGLPTVVVWAGDRELAWAREIVAGSGGHALLAPKTSMIELGALMETARMYIGSDTGPMHMAAAVGTPCVALHGTTRPQDSGAYGPQHIAIQNRYDGGSSRHRRSTGNDAMRLITVEQVTAACAAVLRRLAQSGAA